jgi:hypothetical protein
VIVPSRMGDHVKQHGASGIVQVFVVSPGRGG